MKIAVLSGKGGTGKTTVAASLAVSLPACQYIDCDVEEPNGAIFLQPELSERTPVKVLVPEVEKSKCTACGLCAKTCQFNAIAVVKGQVLIFPEICHHCGACAIACPQEAIREVERTIGVVEANTDDTFVQGKLDIGEPITIPIIIELKKRIKKDLTVILDCSPGASCTVVQSLEGVDYCLLVTEPTPFGLHDLKIAVRLVQKMGLTFGVIVNKASADSRIIDEFCTKEGIDLLMEIPFSQEIAEGYSRGLLPPQTNDGWLEKFQQLFTQIERGVRN